MENNKEIDLSKLNEIDMECDVCDDDDFGGINITKASAPNTIAIPKRTVARDFEEEGLEDRPLKSKTGIILNFNDDDEVPEFIEEKEKDIEDVPTKVITAEFDKNNRLKVSGASSDVSSNSYNEIDMETDVIPDDDDDCFVKLPEAKKSFENKGKTSNFFDDEDDFDEKELVAEDMIEEKVTTQGAVEKNYWDKLQKKHASTNKKGAYNTHFHLAGDPKREMELFNKDMGKPVEGKLAGAGGVGTLAPNGGEPAASSTSSDGVGASAGVTGGGFGESKKSTTSYNKLFESLLDMTGFKLVDNNGKKSLKDTYNFCPETAVNNADECFIALMPYIEDYFICPLQIKTGQNFKNCADWCNWYKDENCSKYPDCAKDIKFCDLIANHAKDINW